MSSPSQAWDTPLLVDHGGVLAIDTRMHGREGVTAVYCFPGPRPAIVETGPSSSLPSVLAGLAVAGIDHLDWIVVTHIHLDHAGAAGHLAKRFPTARVVVRAEGAPHLVDPSRLWASASRLYHDMDGLWGPMLPVDPARIDSVSDDGVVADLGDGRSLVALYTPGHAAHHMALLEPASGDLFTGDALGVYLAEVGRVHPATPPPEFNLEAGLDSLARMGATEPRRLFPTHFGPAPSVGPLLAEGADAMRRAVELGVAVATAGGTLADLEATLQASVAALGLPPQLADRLDHTTNAHLNALGVARYLAKERGLTLTPEPEPPATPL